MILCYTGDNLINYFINILFLLKSFKKYKIHFKGKNIKYKTIIIEANY